MTSDTRHLRAADILTVGFGTTAAMWAVGYFCRLFGDTVRAPVVFVLLLLCQAGGGVVAGRYTARGLRDGLWAGLLTGALNLLIVGSLIGGQTPDALKAGARIWASGSLGVSAAVGGGIGTTIGSRWRRPSPEPDWAGGLAVVAACTTFLLLAAGVLVTGFDEGLAVVDWPNTEGYSMFLYPLARMTGGVYLEHSHRLLGSLVGLTTLVLAFQVQFTKARRWVRRLAWVALLLVIGQGILGGLRVTGHFTLSTQPAYTDPNVLLAIVHGIGVQVALGLAALVVLGTDAPDRPTTALGVAVTTAHQVIGAAVLAWAVMLLLWNYRRLTPHPAAP